MPLDPREEQMIRAFVEPTKRDRYLQLLGNPRRRKKALDTLYHSITFDDRYATELPSKTDVLSLLRAKGAPARCYVISSHARIDGRDMPLADVFEPYGKLDTILISCVPGRLAYYCGEDGERPTLLERPVRKEGRLHAGD